MAEQRDTDSNHPKGDKETHLANIQTAVNEESEQLDAAGKFLAEMALRPDGEYLLSPWTEEEEKGVRRKADWIVLPLLFWSLSCVPPFEDGVRSVLTIGWERSIKSLLAQLLS